MWTARIIFLLLSFWLVGTPPGHARPQTRPTLLAAASVSSTNAPAKPPLTPENKRRAGFLAGAGLVILSLLGLGVALALVRSFKR